MLREESVGPALMVVEVSSEARALFLLAQDRAQPSSDEAIQGAELGWHDILEVAKPPSEHGIEVGDDPPQAHAPALLAHEAGAGLEPVTQEVEPLARVSAVADPRLVRVQREAVFRHHASAWRSAAIASSSVRH